MMHGVPWRVENELAQAELADSRGDAHDVGGGGSLPPTSCA
jgi:hypothetical protein